MLCLVLKKWTVTLQTRTETCSGREHRKTHLKIKNKKSLIQQVRRIENKKKIIIFFKKNIFF